MGRRIDPKNVLWCAMKAVRSPRAFRDLKGRVQDGADLFQPFVLADVGRDPFIEPGECVAGILLRELPPESAVRDWLDLLLRAHYLDCLFPPATVTLPATRRF